MELASPKIIKALTFSQKKALLLFWEMELFKKTSSSYISGENFAISKNKKKHSQKISYILGNGTLQPQA